MKRSARHVTLRYGAAMATVLAAFLVRWLLDAALGEHHPYGTFIIAVLVSAWYAGTGPAVLAMVVSAGLADILFVPPRYVIDLPAVEHQVGFVLFVLVGATGIYASQVARTARDRAEASRQQALRDQEELQAKIKERDGAERALRQSERLYRAIGESINFGIWVCDPEGRNTYASESFLRLVGLTQQECADFGWGRVLHPDEADATLQAWKECSRQGHFWEREHRFRGVDGQWHDVLARGVPIRDEEGRILCWAGINLDISALKQAQQALRDADRRKDEFLATLAHELRNPLAPLRHGLEILQMGPDAQTSAEVQEMMHRQLAQLVRLVDDLLDVSRITRGKVELRKEAVNLADAVQHAVETIRPLLDSEGHELLVEFPDEPIYLSADPVRLTQVFSNLLSNACRYTESQGQIRVRAEQRESEVVVTVHDTGIGIPADLLHGVFEMFNQVDRSFERKRGGLGIGLSLVKGIVELHGGSVEARSDGSGRGSTFVIRLPLDDVGRNQAPREPASAAPVLSHRRVMIVDDNQDAADSLAMLLRSAGHSVQTAYDGRSALEVAVQSRPEFILLDIGMPEMNGYDVARQVRREPWGRDVVLVATTGWGQPQDKRQAREAGFDVHLTKPVDVAAVTAILASPDGRARTQAPQNETTRSVAAHGNAASSTG